jgi:hypothetical protein
VADIVESALKLDEIQQWILVASSTATMLSIAMGVWLSLRESRLKLKGEAQG